MSRFGKLASVAVAVAAASVGLAACGDDGGSSSGGSDGTLIHGTTDQPVSYDPAGSYDLPSYNVIFNVYQNLMQVPPGGNKPEPEAAESCDFTDDKGMTYECTLKDGLKFSDGSDLTSEDVKYVVRAQPEDRRPAGRLVAVPEHRSIETPDDTTVVFNLKAPDATWPLRADHRRSGDRRRPSTRRTRSSRPTR